MPFYLLQVSYTPGAWKRMHDDPNLAMCYKTIQPAVTRNGGKLHNAWLSFGEYDSVCIVEVADNKTAATVSIELSAGGLFGSVKTTPLIPVDDGRDALSKAKI
ncbi:MAG TPA: GYD domain-containing protein [bacterium]|nr:GYD domain-containing protein [bacterium]